MPEATPDLTVEQLAAAAGLPTTTIRMYQHRGLLPGPTKRGRVAYYGAEHLARLRLIAQLQARGYSLAAIKDLVETWRGGRGLTDVLQLDAPSEPELRLQASDLAARFAGVELTAEAMQRAYRLGLVEFDGGEIVVRSPAFLEAGAELAALGIPIAEILDEYEHLRAISDDLARRYTAVFERNLWQRFSDAGLPADEVAGVTASLGRLAPIAERIVVATLRQALAERADRFLADQADELQGDRP